MSARTGQSSDGAQDQAPVVSGSQVFAAGIASTGAAFITSRFGVAGTILGAALTTMIITGGAAVLKAYLESVTGNVRKVPRRLRARRERRKAARYAEPLETLPGRPDLRDNFAGRMRAAVGWFANLPLPARRSILVKGIIGAAVAFVISMAAIYAFERGIGNSLSCGLWGDCPEGATPGIHLGGTSTGANSTLGGGRVNPSGVEGGGAGIFRSSGSDGQSNPLQRQDSGQQQDGSYQQQDPAGGAAPARPRPVEPAQPQDPAAAPGGGAPAAPAQPPAGGAEVPAPGGAPAEPESPPTQ